MTVAVAAVGGAAAAADVEGGAKQEPQTQHKQWLQRHVFAQTDYSVVVMPGDRDCNEDAVAEDNEDGDADLQH